MAQKVKFHTLAACALAAALLHTPSTQAQQPTASAQATLNVTNGARLHLLPGRLHTEHGDQVSAACHLSPPTTPSRARAVVVAAANSMRTMVRP